MDGFSYSFYNKSGNGDFAFKISKSKIEISNKNSIQGSDIYATDGNYEILFNELAVKYLFNKSK